MNLLKVGLIAAFTIFGAASVQATDVTRMTEEERAAFEVEIRAYLLRNPEVILEAIQVLEQRQAAEEAQGDVELVDKYYDQLVNDGFSWVGGNPDGAITIVEFNDYRCAFCKRAYPEVKALLKANPDVRLVMKEFPILGQDSTMASRAAISILTQQGDEIYEKFHNSLMEYNGAINEKTLSKLAEQAGGDAGLMLVHMNDALV